ncbi:retrovirus-related pol polyprotein from transposon TNT 1-94 [Tanacetum coccineum]
MYQKKKENIHQTKESDPTHPLGFAPELCNNNKEEGSNSVNDQRKSVSGKKILSYHKVEASNHHTTCMHITGGSILDVMDDLVKVGQTMAYNMEGCLKNIKAIIGDQGDRNVTQEGYLCSLIDSWDGETVVLGLVDLPLGGYSYTCAYKSASKMCKLDRFLILEGLLDLFPHLSGLCLNRHLSDHCPIIMFELKLDYGLIPFRMFHSWFKMEGFDKFVEDTWDSMNVMDSNGLIRMKKKLQLLKNAIEILVEQAEELESSISYDEIKKVVWECGINKSPGLDGFTFEFFRRYWKIMGQDIVAAVTEFFSTSKFPPTFESLKFLQLQLFMSLEDWEISSLQFMQRNKAISLGKDASKVGIEVQQLSLKDCTWKGIPRIKQSERGISINQGKYVKDLLKKYDINGSSMKTPMVPPNKLGSDLNGKAVNKTKYRGMIGSLMYLTARKPDIQFSTCLYARYQANTKESHLIVVKRIFRYLKGTPNLGLWYPKCLGFNLKGYSDSDYAGCNMDRKSTSGAYQLLGGKLVPISCDNTSAIAISNNLVLHSRTKHIDIRYYFTRDHVLKGDIELHFIPTQYQLADIFTKPLNELTFKRLIVE